MKLPLLRTIILSLRGHTIFRDVQSNGTAYGRVDGVSYSIETITGEQQELPDVFEDTEFEYDDFKHHLQWILRMIQRFGSPFISKFSSVYTSKLSLDDQMAADKVYMDYRRVKMSANGDIEGTYTGLKEAVWEVIVTNTHLAGILEEQRVLQYKESHKGICSFSLKTDPLTGENKCVVVEDGCIMNDEGRWEIANERREKENNNGGENRRDWLGAIRGVTKGVFRGLMK